MYIQWCAGKFLTTVSIDSNKTVWKFHFLTIKCLTQNPALADHCVCCTMVVHICIL